MNAADLGTRPVDPRQTQAIVLAVERFIDERHDRPGLAAGAERFTRWLLDRGVPPENICLLVSRANAAMTGGSLDGVPERPASWQNLHHAVESLRGSPDRLLWIYATSHGVTVPDDGHASWRVLLPSTSMDDVETFGVENLVASLKRPAELGSIDQVICLFDTCRDGFFDRASFPRHDFPVNGRPRADRRILLGFPVREGGLTPFRENGRPGYFTERLLTVLEAAPPEPWPPDLTVVAEQVRTAYDGTVELPNFQTDAAFGRSLVGLSPDRGLDPEIVRGLLAAATSALRDMVGRDASERRPAVDRSDRLAVQLAAQLLVPLRARPDSAAGDRLDELLRTCLEQGKIRELYRTVRERSGPSGDDDRLRQALNELLPSGNVSAGQFWELKRILRQVSGPVPLRLLRLRAKVGASPAFPTAPRPDVLSEVLDIDLFRGLAELVSFLEYLAAWADGARFGTSQRDVRRRLRAWNNQIAEDHDLGQVVRSARRAAEHDRRAGRLDPSLLIRLDRAKQNASRYLVEAWLWPGIDHGDVPITPAAPFLHTPTRLDTPLRAMRAEEVCAWVARLLSDEVPAQLGAERTDQPRLEFFVPPELLKEGVEQWPDNDGTLFCAHHVVLLRSLARNDNVRLRTSSLAKWDNLINVRRPSRAQVRYVTATQDQPQAAGPRLSGDPKKDLCVALTRAPSGDAVRQLHSELLSSGTPAAIWPGAGRSARAFAATAVSLVGTSPLGGLPRRLREWQRVNPTERCVVLLWDDPDRFLPSRREKFTLRDDN